LSFFFGLCDPFLWFFVTILCHFWFIFGPKASRAFNLYNYWYKYRNVFLGILCCFFFALNCYPASFLYQKYCVLSITTTAGRNLEIALYCSFLFFVVIPCYFWDHGIPHNQTLQLLVETYCLIFFLIFSLSSEIFFFILRNHQKYFWLLSKMIRNGFHFYQKSSEFFFFLIRNHPKNIEYHHESWEIYCSSYFIPFHCYLFYLERKWPECTWGDHGQ